ncbi:hypothetical protein IM40_05675 [Candidatus Paracaedimonas acanthamoebae]|nr:hypothetical protein IM40_05675 [Candidatus Paracaedimonas acanthamoebae]
MLTHVLEVVVGYGVDVIQNTGALGQAGLQNGIGGNGVTIDGIVLVGQGGAHPNYDGGESDNNSVCVS